MQATRARTRTSNPDADLFVVRGAKLVRRDGGPISGFGPRIFRFGPFELDESRFELRRDGRPVPISRRVFEVLVFLAENASRTVTKRELIDGPYRGEPVTHSALSRAVHLARKALDEDPRAPQLIRTVRREGFCFVPPPQSRTARASSRRLERVEATEAGDQRRVGAAMDEVLGPVVHAELDHVG